MFLSPNNYAPICDFMIDNPQEGRLSRKRKKLKFCETIASFPTDAFVETIAYAGSVCDSTVIFRNQNLVPDPFYRYKMPKLLAKVEGKGNGIKTVIANMSEIAKALERPPMYPTKYFGCELGAQTNFDAKNERYIVNGEHDANKLQDILDGFIKKFVLCPACENPETQLLVRKNAINSKCKACGHAFLIDNRHKLSTFIIKNPPKIDVDFSKVDQNAKKASTAAAEADPIIEAANGNGGSSNDDDDDWEPEPVEENGALTSGIGKLVLDKDLEKSEDQRLDMLHQFLLKAKEEDRLEDHKTLLNEAERLELKQKASLLLAIVLLDEKILAEQQLAKNRKLFLRFTLNDKKAQRYLIGAIEQLIAKHEDSLLPKSAHIVKALYDTDICEEEAILAWADKPSSKYVEKSMARKIIKNAEAFINWLREAEEESEEDSDIDFDDRGKESEYLKKQKEEAARKAEAKGGKVAPEGPKAGSKSSEDDEDDADDVDIDNI
ncbi:unnamed protein product [Caenorhabditis auriculariae]|uniref:Eukaryotic translation initiation factor 5 n=1 Tax=Caenorhabditis auriculariae TaxID=2777116 RepID=A0A8S1H057_9PELO|nr:unnamed protein product [Caenorhabditis auriculariae]